MNCSRHLLPALVVVLIAGCAGPLAVQQFASDPGQVDVGQTVLLTVTFGGPHVRVGTVFASVREVQDLFYELVNDGTNGDEKAGDNIWSYRVPVPLEAQAGTYHLDFTARDVDGNVIGMKGVDLPASGIAGSLAVTVR